MGNGRIPKSILQTMIILQGLEEEKEVAAGCGTGFEKDADRRMEKNGTAERGVEESCEGGQSS